KKCEVQLAYAIGVSNPVSIYVDTFGTGTVSEENLEKLVSEVFDLRPTSIINTLDLRKPVYEKTAAYGHFGRENEGFTWEVCDKAELLKEKAKQFDN
ncbi:MAG: methionine adenosyltransferase domain-containing protein, partial [Clostridia bacterium]|nr:methionine adenosyltransferase domain-containing protein [Clostridia bacterium]